MASLPSEIGRYKIRSRIGRGGMGDLYLAFDPNTSRLVALKLLNATLDSAELRERFAREARALAALNHSNIVNIYDTGEYDDSPFIVMEYIRGETLAEMIKRRAPMSISEKLKLMAELCAGLAQAHEAGIIHRDIKPANLMVDQLGRLKILDFGIARVTEDNRTRLGLPLTQVNMMIGTPGYMSPEQIEGRPLDHRSDIFAVGAVCYELLSYGEAFTGTNTRQIERGVLQGRPVPLASVVPGLDPEIDTIVFRALKRDPDKRYPDAATFEKALERVRARLGPDEGRDVPEGPTPQPVPSIGGKREVRAEAAYQRALAAHRVNAPESARRYALEALAEDPTHAGAQTLLTRLDRPAARVVPPAAAPRAAGPTAISTSVEQTPSATLANGTLANRTVVRTAVGGGRPASFESEPTVIIQPKNLPVRKPATALAPPAAKRSSPGAPWSKGHPLRNAYEQLWRRDARSGRKPEPAWIRYRWPALAIAAFLVAGVLFFAVRGTGSEQVLTITRPVGGTLSGPGITCGTRGPDCTVSRPNGDPIELTPEADAGFAFAAYTGDCAPGGRTLMTRPRTCGATFVKSESPPPSPQGQIELTIAPVPTGGTIEGLDIICGTKGSVCSAKYPEGVVADFHPTADPLYTFMGFVGDCAPLGHTQMTGPKTCSATFSLTSVVSQQPPIKTPPPSGSRVPVAPPGTNPPPPSQAPESPVAVQPAAPPKGRGSAPVAGDPKDVKAPQTPLEFAKDRIQETLKSYCDALEALDPVAAQQIFPKVNMDGLKVQLNKSKYKSVQCKFGDVVYTSLDPEGGKAKIVVPVKHVFEHTSVKEKPQTDELEATITLVRLGDRTKWLIDTAVYKPKPK